MSIESNSTYWINRKGWDKYEAAIRKAHDEAFVRILHSTKKASEVMSSKSKTDDDNDRDRS